MLKFAEQLYVLFPFVLLLWCTIGCNSKSTYHCK